MLQPATLQFLADLKDNNNREWFEVNRKRYETAKKDVEHLTQALLLEVAKYQEGVADLPPKKCIFRIHRDVRFSKNKAPYKTNMGLHIVKDGKKSGNAGFYLHIEPNNCFLGGGMYMPPSPTLKKIRQEIDYNTAEFRAILAEKNFCENYGKLGGSQLKTAPKGYPRDHPAIDLLRHKDFVAMKSIDDDTLLAEDFVTWAAEAFKAMKPLNDFLNRAND